MGTSRNQSDLNSEKNTGRRSFIRKMGTVVTTGVVVSTVPAAAKSDERNGSGIEITVKELSDRIAILEAEKSIVGLYHTYESLLNDGIYDKISELFTADGETVYNGGLFRGRDTGVKRLYNIRFRNGLTGKKIDATPCSKEEYSINISKDHLSALASFPYSMQAGTPMVSDSVLVRMARLHGGGINKWRENGVCELSLIRISKENVWMINRLEYRTESRSVQVPPYTKVFPADPAGPDTLV
ncbi:MAG: nuclear transport factor 2 family protein [Bacteroidales bacterium]|nr:nuclear transport factor 2 family protein [Bacteroidales bacterium]